MVRATDNAVVAQYGYTPFGQLEAGSFDNVGNPIGFSSRELDTETGLNYFRARYYDPQAGRFFSEDPIGLGGGINLYAYAGNDPINGSDPFGLMTVCAHFSDRTVCFLDPIVVTAGGGGGARPPGLFDGMPLGGTPGGMLGTGQGQVSTTGGATAEGDPCNGYGASSVVGGICRQVNGPNALPANKCAAYCLARQWTDADARKGSSLNRWETARYVVFDHVTCYSKCGYSVLNFSVDFMSGVGVKDRLGIRPPPTFVPSEAYCKFACR